MTIESVMLFRYFVLYGVADVLVFKTPTLFNEPYHKFSD